MAEFIYECELVGQEPQVKFTVYKKKTDSTQRHFVSGAQGDAETREDALFEAAELARADYEKYRALQTKEVVELFRAPAEIEHAQESFD